MRSIRILVMACLSALPILAAAQWQWLDKDGRKVYSDRPPSAEVPAKNILRSPTGGTLNSFSSGPAAAASAPAAPASAGVAAEEAAAAGKAKAQAEIDAKGRADSCRRARDTLLVLRSGVRIKAANAHGDIEVITDTERNSEIERMQGLVASECR